MPLEFLDPGKLRTPLQLQSGSDVADGLGGFARSWLTITDLFAHVEPVSGNARSRGSRDENLITHWVTIRYRDGVQADQRFVRNGRSFDIRSVHDVDETNRYLMCLCEEVKS
jgi:SPP1 family predicted phage head-tail adaptor